MQETQIRTLPSSYQLSQEQLLASSQPSPLGTHLAILVRKRRKSLARDHFLRSNASILAAAQQEPPFVRR